MTITKTVNANSVYDQTSRMLHELGFPVHRIGYKQLCIAIPRYAENDTQSITKELYPFIAKHYGFSDGRAVESSIRKAICDAWIHGDPAIWGSYFQKPSKAPSNMLFIATLSEQLKQTMIVK